MRESILLTILLKKDVKDVSVLEWIKLTIIELYVGDQVLDIVSSVSSFHGSSKGWKKDFEYFIPATFINKIMKRLIVRLIDVKYYKYYRILSDKQYKGELVGYSANSDEIAKISELKICYNTIWVAVNILVDTFVFIVTEDISAALLSGAAIEFFRRFRL